MKKAFLIILAIAIIFIPQFALAKSELDKAKDLDTIGKKFEAQSILREAIIKDPLNANLHYEAGLLYLNMENYQEFNLAMENSCKLNSSNCLKVAEIYYTLAFYVLDKERNIKSAYKGFSKAFNYNPAKRDEALLRLYESGVDWLSRGDIKAADNHFTLLSGLDPTKKESIAKVFFEKAMNASPESSIMLFEKAVSYSPAYKKQVSDKLAEMAKNESYSQGSRDSLKSAAGKYLSRDEMLTHFPPDYKIYQPRSEPYVFNLKAGETTDHWIAFPMGRETPINLKSADYKYIITYIEGDSYNSWEVTKLPWKNVAKFKLTAVTDQQIFMTVK